MAPIISPYSYMQSLLWRLYSLRPRAAAKPGSPLKFDSQQQRPTTAICRCDANNKNVAESGSMMAKSHAVLREYRSDDFFFFFFQKTSLFFLFIIQFTPYEQGEERQ